VISSEEKTYAPDDRRLVKAPKKINLDFKPETYFWPLNLEMHLLSHIKGAKRREILSSAIARSEIDEVWELIGDSELPEEIRRHSAESTPPS